MTITKTTSRMVAAISIFLRPYPAVPLVTIRTTLSPPRLVNLPSGSLEHYLIAIEPLMNKSSYLCPSASGTVGLMPPPLLYSCPRRQRSLLLGSRVDRGTRGNAPSWTLLLVAPQHPVRHGQLYSYRDYIDDRRQQGAHRPRPPAFYHDPHEVRDPQRQAHRKER